MSAERQSGRPSVMVVGAYVEGSGFARVMRHVVARASGECEIHHFGIDYDGEPCLDQGVRVHPSGRTRDDPYGVLALREAVAAVRPRLVFILHDLWFQIHYLHALQPFAGELKVVTYTPIDGDVVHHQSLSALRHVDHCVFYTAYGKRNVEQFLSEWLRHDPTARSPVFSVIPHGVDTGTFYPVGGSVRAQFHGEGRRAARRAVFPGKDLDDAFIVLNANRPTPRKRMDVTLQGFARFARDKPANVKLYLHHTQVTPELRSQVYEAAQALGILDRLLVNPIVDGKAEVPDDCLNLVYNACDVGINTSMGEGWGLVSLEHAATGAAQVVPRHTACGEIWDGAADFLEPVDYGKPWFTPYQMYLVSFHELAAKLDRLYLDPAHRERMTQAAYQRATRPEYAWGSISDAWARVFRTMLEE